jgi:hypothetical protein
MDTLRSQKQLFHVHSPCASTTSYLEQHNEELAYFIEQMVFNECISYELSLHQVQDLIIHIRSLYVVTCL